MPKAARFWPEENILNPALGAAAPWEIQISNQTIFKADEPPDSPGAQPQHVMDGVQQTPSPPTSSALVATFSRSRGREGPEQTGLGSSGFGSEAFAVTQQTDWAPLPQYPLHRHRDCGLREVQPNWAGQCCELNVVSPPNPCVEALTPNVTVLEIRP